MTRLAVTGASGFLGRHVLAALSRTDAEVVAHARALRPEQAVPGMRWTDFDIAESEGAFEKLGRPEIVIHLAWAGLPNYLSPAHVESELPAQAKFLGGLIASGLKRLVVTGTCFEYGMQSGCLSEAAAAAPSNPYGIAKDRLRRDLEQLSETAPFDLRWLRLFYLYGSGQGPASLYSQFNAAVARGDKRFDMSPGDQVRDFMAVEEAASAIVAVAMAPQAPAIVNVCSGVPVTVRGLVERWRAEKAADIELDPGVFPYPAYEPFAFWGDNSRLRALLGEPKSP